MGDSKKDSILSSGPSIYVVYNPNQKKTNELVDSYAKTDQMSHRYLAYRDIPGFIKQFGKGKLALDFGTGTGISANFLHSLGFNVTGTDINSNMLKKAKENFSHINFLEIKNLSDQEKFDLIFSSFVLFDMKSKSDIVAYLSQASSYMKKEGIFIAITGSEELYSTERNWTAYDSKFEENNSLNSGSVAKLKLRNPAIEFHDYFWKESDYIDCLQKAGLNIIAMHKPLGLNNDPYLWEDEKLFSPFTIYILKKS